MIGPFHHTAFGQSAFSVKATTQWNVLPDDMKNCSFINTFKAKLKHLLKTRMENEGTLSVLSDVDQK